MVPVSTAWLRASFGWLFPFLLGRAFIEAEEAGSPSFVSFHFPSFWEGLSLRLTGAPGQQTSNTPFPFLLGRAFIEAFSDVGVAGSCGEISLPFGKGFH